MNNFCWQQIVGLRDESLKKIVNVRFQICQLSCFCLPEPDDLLTEKKLISESILREWDIARLYDWKEAMGSSLP